MPAKAQSVVQSAKAKSGLGRVLFPSAQTGTGALPKQFRAALTSVLTSPTVGLIPDLIDIIMKYSLSIPLSVHTLAVCTTEKMGRPHYGVLWSATASGKRLADDTVLLVTDYLHHRLKAIDLVSGKITTFAGGGKSELDGTKVLEFRFNNPTGISVHPSTSSAFTVARCSSPIARCGVFS